jgi:hypothetical protein
MKLQTLTIIGLGLALSACGTDKRYGSGEGEGGGLSGEDGPGDDDDDGDSEDEDDEIDDDDDGDDAAIRGMVTVELYYDDADGRVPVPWEDVVGESGDFPFGSIFVSAFKTGEDGRETYFDSYTVTRPTIEGDYFSLEVDPALTDMSNVYATLDIRSDGIIASNEPLGVYPEDIIITSGTEADDVNISILVDWGKWGPGGWGWGYGSGGGGGCEDIVSVSGDVDITVPYGGGNGMAMLLDTRGKGPYKYDPFTPIATPDGAEADYQMGMCADSGEYQLVGAYDTNGNGLIDPADLWGAYTAEQGVNGNPINIGESNLEDYVIEVPIDDGRSSMDIVPFVRLSGSAYAEDVASLGDLGDGSLIVAAMKYRMNAEFPVSAFDNAYDLIEWSSEDLDGKSSVDWELVVPANTVVYLWAYIDADADGMVNEDGEPVASGGADSAGALPTGEEGQSDILLGLRIVD